jgi:hypothetical protein
MSCLFPLRLFNFWISINKFFLQQQVHAKTNKTKTNLKFQINMYTYY